MSLTNLTIFAYRVVHAAFTSTKAESYASLMGEPLIVCNFQSDVEYF